MSKNLGKVKYAKLVTNKYSCTISKIPGCWSVDFSIDGKTKNIGQYRKITYATKIKNKALYYAKLGQFTYWYVEVLPIILSKQAYQQEYHQLNKDAYRDRSYKWRAKNPNRYKEIVYAGNREFLARNPGLTGASKKTFYKYHERYKSEAKERASLKRQKEYEDRIKQINGRITVNEYVAKHSVTPYKVFKWISKGKMLTAEKIANRWYLDANEAPPT